MREPDGSKTKLDNSQKFELFKKRFNEIFGELEQAIVPLLPEVAWTDISSKLAISKFYLLYRFYYQAENLFWR